MFQFVFMKNHSMTPTIRPLAPLRMAKMRSMVGFIMTIAQ